MRDKDRTNIRIRSIRFLGINRKSSRKIKVALSTGNTVTIEACCESWEQYGGTEQELWVTMPIAEKYVGWLHGDEGEGP